MRSRSRPREAASRSKTAAERRAVPARLDRRRQRDPDARGRALGPHHHRRLRGHAAGDARRLWPLGRPDRGAHQASGRYRPAAVAGCAAMHRGRARARRLQGRRGASRSTRRACAKRCRDLVERKRVEAIAVCLLWSFRNPDARAAHPQDRPGIDPALHVSLSCEVAPVPGEYERTSTTVINAYAGDITQSYLDESHAARSAASGYRRPGAGDAGLWRPGSDAPKRRARPVGMMECGPAAGVVGSAVSRPRARPTPT